jgi:AbrB family looped-hinge helix DNA binding protein
MSGASRPLDQRAGRHVNHRQDTDGTLFANCHSILAISNWTEQAVSITVDKFGRILIPKTVRDWLGLEPGTELDLEIAEDDGERTIALKPIHDRPLLVDEDGLLVYTGELQVKDFDIVDQIRTDREKRSRRHAGR